MKKRVYIRADMNPQIATGHIRRCLAISDAVRELGGEAFFLTADFNAKRLLEEHGLRYYVLNSRWDRMQDELETLYQIIQKENIGTLLIDSYQVTKKYLENLKKAVKIVLLDDLFLFDYPADEIICYANYCHQFPYDKKRYENLYLGMDYTPLRRVFWKPEKKEIRKEIRRVLVCSGGSDMFGAIETIVGKLKDRYECIDAVCGLYSDSYEKLLETYGGYKNIRIVKDVKDIETYMLQADVAISAGGTALYELCAVGAPAISYAIADNQLKNVMQFEKDGLISYAGDIRREDISENVLTYLEKYESQTTRSELSRKMQSAVDGKGAVRIAKALME